MQRSQFQQWAPFEGNAPSTRYQQSRTAYTQSDAITQQTAQNLLQRLPQVAPFGTLTPTQEVTWRQNGVGLVAIIACGLAFHRSRSIHSRFFRQLTQTAGAVVGVVGVGYALWDRFSYLDLDSPGVAQEKRNAFPGTSFTQFVDSINDWKIMRSSRCGTQAERLGADDLVRYRLFGGQQDPQQIAKLHKVAQFYLQMRALYQQDCADIEKLFSGQTSHLRAAKSRDKVYASRLRQEANWQLDRAQDNLQQDGFFPKAVGGFQAYGAYQGQRAAYELEEATEDEYNYRVAPYEEKRNAAKKNIDNAFAPLRNAFDQDAMRILQN
ncbi:MAG: hypothetical protein JSR80_08435 [Verrucomicrobia bacterium]|nr:hypothetical protein [Verrucomicrobiota bacterium]